MFLVIYCEQLSYRFILKKNKTETRKNHVALGFLKLRVPYDIVFYEIVVYIF